MRWRELDRPVKYAIFGGKTSKMKVVPVKVYSMVPTLYGACLSRTITLFPNGISPDGVQIDYPRSEIFETEKEARKEIFKRKLNEGN